MEARLGDGVGSIAWESPHRALFAITEQLRSDGVPLSDFFSELIVASSEMDSAGDVTPGVAELLREPMTAAESVGTMLLATAAARARDADLDDEALLRLMALAAKLVARFETYLAERSLDPAQ